MIHVDIHGRVQRHSHIGDTVSSQLVGLVDGFGFPVGPVDKVLEDGDGEWMLDVVARPEHGVQAASVQVGAGNGVKFSIYPVKTVSSIVYKKQRKNS